MRRNCILALAAACLLTGVSGCRKTTYDRTVAHVETGGKVLIYQENTPLREPFRNGNAAVKSLLLKNSKGMQRQIFATASDALNVLFDAANPDVVKAVAYSVSGDGKEAPYRLRSFAYLGDRPAPSMFDLIPRKNLPFELLPGLPEETVFAVGGYGCLAPCWKNLRAAAERDRNAQIKLVLEIAETQVKEIFGLSMEEFLSGFDGEQQFFAAYDGKHLHWKAVISDRRSALRKAFTDYAAREEIRKLGEGHYALEIDGIGLLGWAPQLKFGKGNVTIVTSPEGFKTPARPLEKSALWKKYLKDLPRRGTGYAMLRVPSSVVQNLAKVLPDAAALLKMLPEMCFAGVTVRESDGIAGFANSSLLISPCGVPMLPLAGAFAGMLTNRPEVLLPAAAKGPKTVPEDEAGRQVRCRANMKRIMTGLLLYAGKNDDAFPKASGAAGLYELVEKGFAEPQLFRCPADRHPAAAERRHESTVSYYYFGGFTLDDARKMPNAPLLIEKPGIHSGNPVHVLFADGHWEAVKLPAPYTDLKQALSGCLALHPLPAEQAAKLQASLPAAR